MRVRIETDWRLEIKSMKMKKGNIKKEKKEKESIAESDRLRGWKWKNRNCRKRTRWWAEEEIEEDDEGNEDDDEGKEDELWEERMIPKGNLQQRRRHNHTKPGALLEVREIYYDLRRNVSHLLIGFWSPAHKLSWKTRPFSEWKNVQELVGSAAENPWRSWRHRALKLRGL